MSKQIELSYVVHGYVFTVSIYLALARGMLPGLLRKHQKLFPNIYNGLIFYCILHDVCNGDASGARIVGTLADMMNV